MKLIIGLGNPGSEYEYTRHNVGFMVVDRLARELGKETANFQEDRKSNALVAKVGDVLLIKPQTFVNSSGVAVGNLIRFYKLGASDVWVVHDDIDLPIGKIRIRQKGGSAGHRGVDSIIECLKSDAFVRFRLGVGRGKESVGLNTDKHMHHRSIISLVLSRFRTHEAGSFKHLIKNGTEAVRIALTEGIDKAMNRFN